MLACIVDVGRRVDDPQARRREIASRRRRNLEVLHACKGSESAQDSRDDGTTSAPRTEDLRSTPGWLFQMMISRMNGYREMCLTTSSSPFLRFQCSRTAETPTTGEVSLQMDLSENRAGE